MSDLGLLPLSSIVFDIAAASPLRYLLLSPLPTGQRNIPSRTRTHTAPGLHIIKRQQLRTVCRHLPHVLGSNTRTDYQIISVHPVNPIDNVML
jgi:hypothetical protein